MTTERRGEVTTEKGGGGVLKEGEGDDHRQGKR